MAKAWDDYASAKVRHAVMGSELAFARVRGMKIRTAMGPPKAAKGTFPYAHRTCAQWTVFDAYEGKGWGSKVNARGRAG